MTKADLSSILRLGITTKGVLMLSKVLFSITFIVAVSNCNEPTIDPEVKRQLYQAKKGDLLLTRENKLVLITDAGCNRKGECSFLIKGHLDLLSFEKKALFVEGEVIKVYQYPSTDYAQAANRFLKGIE